MQIEVISPSKQLFSAEIEMAQFPGVNGSFQVLKNHAPIIALISAGNIRVRKNDGKEEDIAVKGGVVEVQNNKILVLAE
ncbi:MAG: ATP synthase F1 subunit epsilon [Bacteroidales bacterium]|nr:ATP synthase F1 subunit epsilon [Bacteroidales bacterium]